MEKKVFVSYSRRDIDKVKEIIGALTEKLGDIFWIDLEGIESGEEFVSVIVNAIKECDILLFMHSTNAIKSEYAQKEVGYASRQGKKVVPLLIDGNGLQDWFDFQYGGIDTIDPDIPLQFNKLIENLSSWLNIEIREESEDETPKFQEETDPDEKYFDQNDVVAQQYELGDDVAKNYEIAFQQYQVYVKKNNDYVALDKLAICYAQGIGVTKDIEKAKELFMQSIHLGHTPAIEHYKEYIGLEAGVVMFIEDIFTIRGSRSVFVTGVLTSDIQVGDNVIIRGDNDKQIESTITGVEMFSKLLDAGEAGDNVGLLLRNVDAKSIAPGMMIMKDMK